MAASFDQKKSNYCLRRGCLKLLPKFLQHIWLWVKKWLHRYDRTLIERVDFANERINLTDIVGGNFLMLRRKLRELFFQDAVILQTFALHLFIFFH